MQFFDSGPDEPDLESTSFSGPQPYERVQMGFRAFWSARGFGTEVPVSGREPGLGTLRQAIESLAIDPVLHPEIAAERVVARSQRLNANGDSVLLIESRSYEGSPLLWFGNHQTKFEQGCCMLAMRSTARPEEYQLSVHLDKQAFDYDRSRLPAFDRKPDQLELPLLVLLIENRLQSEYPNEQPAVLRVRKGSASDTFLVSTSIGVFEGSYCCHSGSCVAECRLGPLQS